MRKRQHKKNMKKAGLWRPSFKSFCRKLLRGICLKTDIPFKAVTYSSARESFNEALVLAGLQHMAIDLKEDTP